MSAAPDYDFTWPGRPPSSLTGLLDAASAAVSQLADQADLDAMADRDAAAVMGTLTTLVGRLDGLRVQVARAVRARDICGLRGTRSLAGWLRADARLADDAWKIGRLAAAGPELPQITALLGAGTIGLGQAATACWQIAQLPAVPIPPAVIKPPEPPGTPEPGDAPGPDGTGGSGSPASEPGAPDDSSADPCAGGSAEQPGSGPAADPMPVPGPSGLPAGVDPSGAERWAGLWRAGDVHAAADQLFAAFLPGLDSGQLRQLGAHLREAADTQDRAADDRDDYARRGLRISRSLHGAGEITGRLHAEAAEQVITAFEQLGRKTGPDDTRTKAQRWADVLTRLTGAAADPLCGPAAADAPPGPTRPARPTGPDSDPATPAAEPAGPGDDKPGDDDQPSPADRYTGHDHASQDHHSHAGQEHGVADARRGSGSLADASRGHVPAGLQRPRIIVTVPLDTLLGRPLAPGATFGPGTPLTAEAARRLTCDADIIRLITAPRHPPEGPSSGGRGGDDTDGRWDATAQLTRLMAAAIACLPPPLATPSAVLDIGRKSPGWTPRQRDALYVQAGGHCGFGRCDGPIEVIHHIIHWLYGGKTRIINGFPCCLHHHWLIHEGGWRIKKHPDGTITTIPPPPGWRPGTIYRNGRPVTKHAGPADTL